MHIYCKLESNKSFNSNRHKLKVENRSTHDEYSVLGMQERGKQ